MKSVFYLSSVDRRWKKDLMQTAGRVIILSPYLSSPTAERVVQSVPAARCEVYTRFSVEDFANGATSLRTLKKLLLAGYPVYELDRLHAKLILASGSFATIGSQNLTRNGITNREATAIFLDPDDVRRVEDLVARWLSSRRAISLEMVADLLGKISPVRRYFRNAKKATEKVDAEIWHGEKIRQDMQREAQHRRSKCVKSARDFLARLMPDGKVSRELASRIVANSTWWHRRRYGIGGPVRAPNHVRRMYGTDGDFRLDFGANTFLVSRAIRRCRETLDAFLADCEAGTPWPREKLIRILQSDVQGAVANARGIEYAGLYPLRGNDMMFGVTSIDVNDVITELLSGIPKELVEETKPAQEPAIK